MQKPSFVKTRGESEGYTRESEIGGGQLQAVLSTTTPDLSQVYLNHSSVCSSKASYFKADSKHVDYINDVNYYSNMVFNLFYIIYSNR